ncbi:MAG: hypothetical protein ACFFCR_13135, partial [Promethearchaeota archaeon]
MQDMNRRAYVALAIFLAVFLISGVGFSANNITSVNTARSLEIVDNTYTASEAVIWTDKPDYDPGEIVTIYGSGFNPDSSIEVNVTRPDSTVDTGYPTSDAMGDFVYYYDLDGILGSYTVTATDGVNEASTTFTDGLVVDFRQLSTLPSKLWISNALQSSNSEYSECMSVPQRLVFDSLPATPDLNHEHVLFFEHKTTQGGVHAYDWLTGWDQGNIPPLIDSTDLVWGEKIGPPSDLWETCRDLYLGDYHYLVPLPDDEFVSKDGSTLLKIEAYEQVYGDRFLRISGNQPIDDAWFTEEGFYHDVGNGEDNGNSYIYYELRWISQSDEILIEFGGHLALSGDPSDNSMAWGVDLGASSIDGGPYHIKLNRIDDCQLGSQDNQIQAGAVLPAATSMTVSKTGPATALPGDYYDYTIIYDNTGPDTAQSVTLVDALPPEVTYVSNTGGGTYDGISHSVTWNLGDVPSGGTGSVTVTVQVSLGLPDYTVMHNEVSLTWTNPNGSPGGPETDTVDTTLIKPFMTFVKWRAGAYDNVPGSTVTFYLD